MYMCEACDTIPPKPANWVAYYLKGMRGTFGTKTYYCDECLMDDLEGVHTGGGPTLSSYWKIIRLNAGKIKPSDLYAGVEPEYDHWQYWYHYLWMKIKRRISRFFKKKK